MIEHKEAFKSNQRMGMIYNILSKMADKKITLIQSDSNRFLKALKDD